MTQTPLTAIKPPFGINQVARSIATSAVDFEFNGKAYSGFDGDTLASALLANGVFLTARSFKYHRPRGCHGRRC